VKSTIRIALLIAAIAALLAVPTALAGKGGKPGGGGPRTTSLTGTLSMVLVNSADSLANYGEGVRFNVSTNAAWPFVDVDCFQAGSSVYHSTVGYYGGWPWGDTFTLSGWSWTGGAADCVAKLYNSDGTTNKTITTLSFHVYA
jgi:hypothetical protein